LPASAGESLAVAQLLPLANQTTNKWFLVGLAAADLKSPEASGGDDTEK
jgi:hypothetical protein